MSLVRRSLAALSGLFLLQLTLLGSGTLCAMHRGVRLDHASMHRSQQRTTVGEASMRMHQHAATSANDTNVPTRFAACGSSDQQQPCRLPFAPGTCTMMSMCDVSAAPASISPATFTTTAAALELLPLTAAHSGPTFAPELPPPRA